MTDTPETNAAKRPQGLRACADGLDVNPDKVFAQKCMRHASDRMEQLERERDEARERADTMFVKHAEILDQAKRERDEMKEALEYILGIGLTVKTTERAKRALGIHGQNDKVSDSPVTYGASLVIPTNPSWANSPIHQEVQKWEEKSIRAQDGRICQCEDAPKLS